MVSTDSTEEISNATGAIVFVGYVFAALFLTTFLIYSLLSTYLSLDSIYKRVIDKKLQVLTMLLCVSFCVLSYLMLSYLIVSYKKTWVTARNILLPIQSHELINIVGYSDRTPQLHFWQWLKTSTLFRNFAQTICMSSGAFFWTGQALVATMTWSVFMGVEGVKHPFMLISQH